MTFVCLSSLAVPTDGASATELARRLLGIAPRVRVDEAGPLVWLDARGLPARPLAEASLLLLRETGCPTPRAGVAATPIAAEVAARLGPEPLTEVPPGADREFLAPHRVAVLGPDDDLRRLLEGSGIERCGELAALDRAAVEVRFGSRGVALWRLARADDRRRLFQPVPRPLPHASLAWTDYALRDPERLLFVINDLAGSVCAALRERGEGARGFTLVFALANGARAEQPFRPARAGADRRAWLRLARRALERLEFPDGIVGVELRVDAVAPLESVQGDLLDRGFGTARVAEEAVARAIDQGAPLVRPEVSRHPLPRRRTRWLEQPPALVWARPQLAPDESEPSLALHLLPEPEPVEVVAVDRRGCRAPVRYRGRDGWHDLVTASGPDCLSGDHWGDAYACELFCCVRADGEIVLLGRDLRRDAWHLEGLWR